MRIQVNDTEFYCQRHGRGVPILVLHGGPGLDHSYFRPWLDGLGGQAELIYIDLRGNGRSGGKQTLDTVTVEAWAADIDAVRAALNVERAVVLGHGFGGFVAQQYAHDFPQHVLGLVLCSTTPALDYPAVIMANAQAQANAAQMQAVMQLLSQPVRDDVSLRRLWMLTLPLYFNRYEPNIGAGMDDTMAYSAAAYNRGMFGLVPTFNSTPWLAHIRAKTLILAGRHDWWMPFDQGGQRLQAGIPGSTAHVFEQSGHFPFIEETVGFCQTLRDWLRKL